MKQAFTTPKVVRSKKGDMYVYFRFYKKVKTIRGGLNYITFKNEREKALAFEDLRKEVHRQLKSGWNPFENDLSFQKNNFTLIEALDFALEKKKANLKPRTYESYFSSVKFFKEAAIKSGFEYMPVIDVKRVHVKKIMAKCAEIRKWSNKAYNKNMGYIKAVFSEMLEWDILENNPAHSIRKLKEMVNENANRTPTKEENEKIKKQLTEKMPGLLNYLRFIYHTGIRPDELFSVKIGMIEIDSLTIRIPAEITKTLRDRILPINPYLFNLLLDMDIDKYPDDYYLFGSRREHRNLGIKPETDFLPAPYRLNRSSGCEQWKKLIKDALGIDVNMYAYKHYGADNKILAGIDLDALRELYGHTSKMMTMRYAKKVKEVYRKQIIEQSPDM
ncbi:tyrosine-type recombinase/integrase [Flavobacterium coralii]|uniref:tyrosine-type recombinase/integrase n=1 Tax=Flavobacterium coralii TaxID=2838017 RepID=UPI000C3E7200|nr:hypothetical protein [Flavobacterium sp.]|tara:strand:+ start:787 stop:1950 length:1164 start_codon:yes stop_codon:yes gene_type:complete